MEIIKILIIAAAAVFILLLIASLVIFLKVFGRYDHEDVNKRLKAKGSPYLKYIDLIENGAKWIKEKQPQEVFITSFDNLKLKAIFIPANHPQATMVLVHGFKSSALNDFGSVAKFYHELGLNLLLVTQRAHGKSEGRFLTFGVKERFDCIYWADFAANEYKLPVFLDGISMGCSSVLMATEFKLNKAVKGIIGDCGFTSPYDIIEHFSKDRLHLPAFPLIYLVDFWARIIGGFSLKECSTVSAVKNNKIPIILLHGTNDRLVPCFMGQKNFDAITSIKDIIIVEGAEHGLSYLLQKELCEQKITEFIKNHIND